MTILRRDAEAMAECGDASRPPAARVPAWGLIWPGLSAAVAVSAALYGLVVTPLQKANELFQERILRDEITIAELQSDRVRTTSWQSHREKEIDQLRTDLTMAIADRAAHLRRVEDKAVTVRDFDQLRGMFEQHIKERHDRESRKR